MAAALQEHNEGRKHRAKLQQRLQEEERQQLSIHVSGIPEVASERDLSQLFSAKFGSIKQVTIINKAKVSMVLPNFL